MNSPFSRLPDPGEGLANRMLEREAWSRDQLVAHAGRTFTLAVGMIARRYKIAASGLVEAQDGASGPSDLKLSVSPLAVPTLLADPARFEEFVTREGDPALARALRDVAQTIPWFVERSFADLLGPIVGQRLADAGRALLAFPEAAAGRLGASVSRYVRDEAKLALGRDEAAMLEKDVRELAAAVDGLAARVDALSARASSAPG